VPPLGVAPPLPGVVGVGTLGMAAAVLGWPSAPAHAATSSPAAADAALRAELD
jgi:hypothetical protein